MSSGALKESVRRTIERFRAVHVDVDSRICVQDLGGNNLQLEKLMLGDIETERVYCWAHGFVNVAIQAITPLKGSSRLRYLHKGKYRQVDLIKVRGWCATNNEN